MCRIALLEETAVGEKFSKKILKSWLRERGFDTGLVIHSKNIVGESWRGTQSSILFKQSCDEHGTKQIPCVCGHDIRLHTYTRKSTVRLCHWVGGMAGLRVFCGCPGFRRKK